MKKSASFLKIAGIGIYIHWTFSLLIIWVIYLNARAGLDPLQISWSVLFVLSMFVCVVLHELGHALTAKKFGIRTQDITLYPIGGVARLEKMPEKPSQELAVALAGPLINVIIMLILLPLIIGFDFKSSASEEALIIGPSSFLPMLGILNVWLALFNLIPAFPMDGGRVLRALLAMRLGRVRATNIAAQIGKFLAFGFIIAGFYYNPFLIFIGVFIILGAQSEAEMVRNREIVTGLKAVDAMMTHWDALGNNHTIGDAVKLLLAGSSRNFVVMHNGIPSGIIGRDQLIKGLSEHGEKESLELVTDRNLAYAAPSTPLEEIFSRFQENRIPIVIVEHEGAVIGVIDAENIAELILVRQAQNRFSGKI